MNNNEERIVAVFYSKDDKDDKLWIDKIPEGNDYLKDVIKKDPNSDEYYASRRDIEKVPTANLLAIETVKYGGGVIRVYIYEFEDLCIIE